MTSATAEARHSPFLHISLYVQLQTVPFFNPCLILHGMRLRASISAHTSLKLLFSEQPLTIINRSTETRSTFPNNCTMSALFALDSRLVTHCGYASS